MTNESHNLPFLDPSDQGYMEDPFAQLEEARSESWLARSPRGYEVLTFEAVQAMFRDRRFHEGGPQIAKAAGLEGEAYELRVGDMMFQEADQHAKMRRVVAPFFTPRAMEQQRARAKALFDEHLAAIEASGGGDVVAELAVPVPSKLFCELLGAPAADAPFLAEVTQSSLKAFLLDPSHAEEISDAMFRLRDYLSDLAEERAKNPGDDFISALAVARENGELTTEEMVHLAISVVEGSSDNTSATLAISLLTFARHQDQWEKLVEDPGLAAAAAEECMRFLPRVRAQQKCCDEPTEFMGFQFPAEAWIFQSLDAANRDPAVFPDPDEFEIDRADRGRQMAFGTGRHICLGAPLARIELAEALETVARRWESFELVGEPEMLIDANIRGVERMAVTVETRRNGV